MHILWLHHLKQRGLLIIPFNPLSFQKGVEKLRLISRFNFLKILKLIKTHLQGACFCILLKCNLKCTLSHFYIKFPFKVKQGEHRKPFLLCSRLLFGIYLWFSGWFVIMPTSMKKLKHTGCKQPESHDMIQFDEASVQSVSCSKS